MWKAAPKPGRDGSTSPVNLYALKVTTPSTVAAPHDTKREARILEESRHNNVIELIETFWQPGGRFVLVFPYMQYDLKTLLLNHALDGSQQLRILGDLFRALAHIHSLNILHRDVKPGNILLRSRGGPAYLADFGIAWSPNHPGSERAGCKMLDVGTTSYRAPELLFGYTAYGSSLDMWAAGCVVAEVVRPNHEALFDAGPLGSELGLIKSIFSTLGTPNDNTWPASPHWSFSVDQWLTSVDCEALPGLGQDAVRRLSSM